MLKSKVIELIEKKIESHEKSYRNAQSYTEDGNGWIRGKKETLQELLSEIQSLPEDGEWISVEGNIYPYLLNNKPYVPN